MLRSLNLIGNIGSGTEQETSTTTLLASPTTIATETVTHPPTTEMSTTIHLTTSETTPAGE